MQCCGGGSFPHRSSFVFMFIFFPRIRSVLIEEECHMSLIEIQKVKKNMFTFHNMISFDKFLVQQKGMENE